MSLGAAACDPQGCGEHQSCREREWCDPQGCGEHQSCREREWCGGRPTGMWGTRIVSGTRLLRRARRTFGVGALLYIGATLLGCSRSEAPIEVTDAWAPATPPNASIGAAYMQIEAREADTLIELSSPVAELVELHRTSFEEGVATMRKADAVVISPDTPLVLAPNGMHIMLHQLVSPLEAGQHFSVTLRFQRAGEVTAQIEVRAAGEHQNHH
jgi:periplasmic copper chaperone A